MKENYEQIPLLNIEQYTNYNSPVYTYDPYWDELQQEHLSSNIENSQISKHPSAPERLEVVEQFFKSNELTPTLAHQQYLGVGEQVKVTTKLDISEICVGEQVKHDTQKSAHQQEKPAHWIERYWVERGGKKYWYYRYTWMAGRKMHRVYIGSVRSRQAQTKVDLVREAISNEKFPCEIRELISSPIDDAP